MRNGTSLRGRLELCRVCGRVELWKCADFDADLHEAITIVVQRRVDHRGRVSVVGKAWMPSSQALHAPVHHTHHLHALPPLQKKNTK